MRTHRNAAATKGEVIRVCSSNTGKEYCTVIITDSRSTGRPVEGGHECRNATPSEIAQAKEIKTHYE